MDRAGELVLTVFILSDVTWLQAVASDFTYRHETHQSHQILDNKAKTYL